MSNVLITALSKFNPNAQQNYYRYFDNGREINVIGEQTNDTVPLILSETFKINNQELNKVIILCTEEADSKISETETCFQRYKNSFNDLFKFLPKFHKIPLNNNANLDSMQLFNACIEIDNHISDGDRIYIDTTGGFRDSVMYIIAALQLLKFKKVTIENVFYVNYQRDNSPENPCIVNNRTDMYSAFDLISGLDELLNYGSTKKLCDYFNGYPLNQKEKNILDALTLLSEEIKLCRVIQIGEAIGELKGAVYGYDNNLGNGVFDKLVFQVKEKFKPLFAVEHIDELSLIEWCFKNGYVSQTLSFYFETVPKILVDKKAIYPSDEVKKEVQSKPDKHINIEDRTWKYRFITDYLIHVNEERFDATLLIDTPEFVKNNKSIRSKAELLIDIYNWLDFGNKKIKPKNPNFNDFRDLLLKYKTDVCTLTGSKSLKNTLHQNQKFMNEWLGVVEEGSIKAYPEKCTRVIMDAIDNFDIYSDINRKQLEQLILDYFYFYNQRNSVLHVGTKSDNPKVVNERFEAAIERLKELNNI